MRHTAARGIAFSAAIALSLTPAEVRAGANPTFVLPLHAKVSASEACDGYLPLDCRGIRPTVTVPAATDVVAFLLLWNHCEVVGVQTAFAWDQGWEYLGSSWGCRQNQISVVVPHSPGGATAGTIATAFDCVTGPELAVVGLLRFRTGLSGCLRQVQSSYPYGNHVVDCRGGLDLANADDPLHTLRFGRICVGTGGHHPCDPGIPPCPVPVDATTWGRIKATYD